MNRFQTINTQYLRPSRTVDTVLVSNSELKSVYFIYNYEGTSFRVFKNTLNLIDFFLGKCDSDFHFCTDNELDDFLLTVKINP